MSLERQTTYGWVIAIDLFLGATGAGAFLVSFILKALHKYEAIASVGALLGPLLVLLGVLFLLADVTVRTKVYRLFSNPASWTARGTWIVTIFIILALLYSVSSFIPFGLVLWSNVTVNFAVGIVAAIFSVLVMAYTGFVFAVIKAIPFWNTLALPLIFLISGLCTGIAVLLLIMPFVGGTLGQDIFALLHTLSIAEISLVLVQLLVLWGYIEIASHAGVASLESVRLLRQPGFIVGVILIGLVLPLGLLSWIFISTTSIALMLAVIAGVLLLVGGLFLRYSVISVGVYPPRFSI